jgi:hypothetical protein
MSNPLKSSVWATQVDASTRAYVDARLHEELKPVRDDTEALRVALLRIREASQSDMGQLTARVNDAEELIKMSSWRVSKLRSMATEED